MYYSKLKGFTLIELLIVVAIIAILAAIAVPNFLEAQTRAKVAKVKSDMRSLATALETYYVDYNNYVPAVNVGENRPWDQGGPYHPSSKYVDGSNTYGGYFDMLSTPVAYIANSYISDPFFNPQTPKAWYSLPNPLGNHIQYTASTPVSQAVWRGRTKGTNFSRGDVCTDQLFPWASINPQLQWWTLWSIGPDQEYGVFVEYPQQPYDAPSNLTLGYMDIHTLGKARQGQNPLQQAVTETSDNNWNWGPIYWNHEVANSIVSQFLYDPTNGTRSQGNVYRTGGTPLSDPDINHRDYGGLFWIFTKSFTELTD